MSLALRSCVVLGGVMLAGCASEKPPPASPASAGSPRAESAAQAAPAPPSQPGSAPTPATPSSRTLALQNASGELESAQRELDVAAGDCRNACRALGSMDRAAGRLCALTGAGEDTRRCDDAKQRVYSARDRVKATCGPCEGGPSVERSAPVPSLR